MVYCSKCGTSVPDGARFCPKCGAEIDNSYNWDDQSAKLSGDSGHGTAVGSLVCGIVGIVMCFFGYGSIVSIILGIIGAAMAASSKRAGNYEGIRTAGSVLSVLSIIGGCLVLAYLIAFFSLAGSVYSESIEWLYNLLN